MNLSEELPITEINIALYIAHLWNLGLKASSIRSNLSALSFFHKINRKSDPCSSYFIRQVLKGAENRSGPSKLKLLPISKQILHKMIDAIPSVIHNIYDKVLFKALLLLSYYCCLRAGEAVYSNSLSHTLSFHQIHITNLPNERYITINFESYKHCIHSNLKFHIESVHDKNYCPVSSLIDYINFRGREAGPIFIHLNKTPVKRSRYSSIIKSCVSLLGLDPKLYNTHSLRIGRATDLALLGTSLEVIKQTGRWSSSAYLRYIRLGIFKLPMC